MAQTRNPSLIGEGTASQTIGAKEAAFFKKGNTSDYTVDGVTHTYTYVGSNEVILKPGYTKSGSEEGSPYSNKNKKMENLLVLRYECWTTSINNLTITKDVNNATPAPGETVVYTITVTNKNPDWVTVKVVDEYLEGMTFGKSEPAATLDAGGYTWEVALEANETKTIKLWATVGVDAEDGMVISNTATVYLGNDKLSDTVDITVSEPKHLVTYEWDGLPANHGQTIPAGGSYAENAPVTVDNTYPKDKEVTVDGRTYVFSGWDKDNFTMPGHDVTINGTWTPKYQVTYTWTGPEGLPQLPVDSSAYKEGDKAPVDTTYTEGREVTVGEDTYVFSGWKTFTPEEAVVGKDGKVTMPASDVIISGTWTKKEAKTFGVTYQWQGLPDGAAALPVDGTRY